MQSNCIINLKIGFQCICKPDFNPVTHSHKYNMCIYVKCNHDVSFCFICSLWMYIHTYEYYIFIIFVHYILNKHVHMYVYTGRLVLKKYYNFLWRSFPQDHLVSYDRLNKMLSLERDIYDLIFSSETPEPPNQRILNFCIYGIGNDKLIVDFFSIVKNIISNPKLSKILNVFKNGEFQIHNCVCTYLYVCTYVCVYIGTYVHT